MSYSRDPGDLLITREHTKWMQAGRRYTTEAVDTMVEVIRRDMGTAHRSDGANRVRASMLGDPCLRRQQLSFHGETGQAPSIELQHIFDVGTFGHYRWQFAGLSAGWLADVEVLRFTDDNLLGGNLDGLMSDGSVFEFKTINPTGFRNIEKAGEPMKSHVLQMHCYMMAVGTDKAHILYEDKSYGARFYEIVVHRDDEIIKQVETIRDRVSGPDEVAPLADCIRSTGKVYGDCGWVNSCQPYNWR